MAYLSEEQIFQDILLYKLSEKQKEDFKNIAAEDLIMLHHSFGQWIRNNYDLWREDNPHVILNDAMHDLFPDQVSQRIIERLWCQLTGKSQHILPHEEIKETSPGVYEFRRVKIQVLKDKDKDGNS